MYLLNNHEGMLARGDLAPLAGAAETPIIKKTRWLFDAFTDDERSLLSGGLLFIAVLSLHLWAAYALMKPVEALTLAKPLLMEASLVSVPNEHQAATAAPPAPSKPVQPIQPKKTALKPPVRKNRPVIKKRAELPKPKPVTEHQLPKPSLAETAPAPASSAPTRTPSTSNTAASLSNAHANSAPFTEANFRANYGFNPKPNYPAIARNRGWEGKVLLKVTVSADGHSDEVTLHRSSGHEALDESAIAAVKKWRFIPARRGETEVASSVIVPINFTLNN
ncbi:Outer membrane transport energization protein TonB [Candidatus Methylobacter favarea]|uniref:Outer membrane transport energization protein TonB n=1 Tax=Candidatus Methylobacter favarea TaxID=2707345 RepID=A0A8S0XL08_9GAMM|nr:energy transducer TonB [Candidatus Methylobacter favarea]CAA9892452.1 Outer membrane transport energization protein TonB [Candidatus Methylobacter favarea]